MLSEGTYNVLVSSGGSLVVVSLAEASADLGPSELCAEAPAQTTVRKEIITECYLYTVFIPQ